MRVETPDETPKLNGAAAKATLAAARALLHQAPTLTAQETADLFGVHVESLRQQVRKGTFPIEPLRLGRALRFPTAKVLKALGIEE